MNLWNTYCKSSSRTKFIRTRTNFRYQENAMTRKILILALLSVTTLFALPADANAQREWRTRDRSYSGNTYSQNRWENRSSRRRYRRVRDTSGYRNYGQYRRTQVGNRRFRNVRTYYWNGGRRLSRWTRVYY